MSDPIRPRRRLSRRATCAAPGRERQRTASPRWSGHRRNGRQEVFYPSCPLQVRCHSPVRRDGPDGRPRTGRPAFSDWRMTWPKAREMAAVRALGATVVRECRCYRNRSRHGELTGVASSPLRKPVLRSKSPDVLLIDGVDYTLVESRVADLRAQVGVGLPTGVKQRRVRALEVDTGGDGAAELIPVSCWIASAAYRGCAGTCILVVTPRSGRCEST